MLRGRFSEMRNKMSSVRILFIILFVACISLFTREFIDDVQSQISEPQGNLGMFYFKKGQLDIVDFPVTYTRIALVWGLVEPREGEFAWDVLFIKQIDRVIEKGIVVIPNIKTAGAIWAIVEPKKKEISSPPKDLSNTFDPQYGYSKTYYRFIKNIAERYKGKFKIVVIENEVTADNFWAGTMDEYIKIAATAKKAFSDVDPQVKIADSGLASPVWGNLIAYELLSEGRAEEALDFLKKYMIEHPMNRKMRLSSIVDVKRYFQEALVKKLIQEALYLLSKLKSTVDIVNFHYYEDYHFLPEVIEYIKEETGDLPLMNNELGSRKNNKKEAALEITKKSTICLAYDVYPSLWFPFSKPVLHPFNILPPDGQALEYEKEPMQAYLAVLKYLNHKVISHEDISSKNLKRFIFRFKDFNDVEVCWGEGGEANIEISPGNYKVYDFMGNEMLVENGLLRIASEPIYLVKKE